MNRREFTAAMLAAGAAIPLGITRAAGQTKGGTLNTIIQPEPPILVTAFNQQQPTLTLGGKLYESLLKYGADLKPMPGLAQSWGVSPDGRTFVMVRRSPATRVMVIQHLPALLRRRQAPQATR